MGFNPRDCDNVKVYRWAMPQNLEIPKHWPDWKREIAERLNATGTSMKEASVKAGLGETWVRDALKRDKEPTLKNLTKVKEVLGIRNSIQPTKLRVSYLPVIGRAQAGAFLDVSIVSQDEEFDTIPMAEVPKYAHARQYALLVVGDSMNNLFDDGQYAICANWADLGLKLRPGMCLHIERHEGSLVEVTIKCYQVIDGAPMLVPRSSNPAHKPIPLDIGEDGNIFVKGLVIGAWKSIDY
jgi:SOS-response transcriptional repressor LexA